MAIWFIALLIGSPAGAARIPLLPFKSILILTLACFDSSCCYSPNTCLVIASSKITLFSLLIDGISYTCLSSSVSVYCFQFSTFSYTLTWPYSACGMISATSDQIGLQMKFRKPGCSLQTTTVSRSHKNETGFSMDFSISPCLMTC